ncbi:ATP-binding protein [Brevibacillus borstelensis]|uniref:ATP-binding protein n=1 Tax=Brevibacillus borstelensis TaxID=45462 RepID=UPI0004682274|nr:ATP-binding protein [Brevibacillus borstelensis]
MRLVQLPNVNDDPTDFYYLFDFSKLVSEVEEDILVDFSQCGFLRQNAVAMLGGLARKAESRGIRLHFKWDSLTRRVKNNLRKNGFMGTFASFASNSSGNSIPYREDLNDSPDSYIEYLKEEWLHPGWVNMSPALREAITSKVYEIYRNAFDHGLSSIGVFSCGQLYPNLSELRLSIVDFGIGIPTEVKHYLRNHSMNASDALSWAFKIGNTTKPSDDHGRGLGLGILKDYIKANNGILEIYSNDGYVKVTKNQEVFQNTPYFFGGTIFNITIKQDESYYCFASEVDNDPLF